MVRASVLLSRPPVLTRDLTPFEKAYFLYQKRLNERLVLPFSRYFYYQKGTPGDVEWKRKIKERLTPARDIGKYNAYDREAGWNDEVLVGARESEPEEQVEALLRDAEVEVKKEVDEEGQEREVKKELAVRPMPRVTEADRVGDTRSLDRLLQRTLYLVVKRQDGRWWFPSDGLVGKESLHTVRGFLDRSCGAVAESCVVAGCRANPCPSRWAEHEHMDRRQHPSGPFRPQLRRAEGRDGQVSSDKRV